MPTQLQKKRKKKKNGKKHSNHPNVQIKAGAESNCCLSAKVSNITEESRPDVISELPNDILYYIISFLPAESTVKTRLLSTHWRDLWDQILSIQHGTAENMIWATYSFLRRVDWVKPLKHPWKLEFHCNDGSVVLRATTGAKNKLHLDFSHNPRRPNPAKSFKLSLDLPKSESFTGPAIFCVKSLYLESVDNLSSDMVSSLIPLLHFLKSLVLKNCNGLYWLSIRGGSSLHCLSILSCPHIELVVIRPHEQLNLFHYRGRNCCISTSCSGLLEDVMLDFKEGPGFKEVPDLEKGPYFGAFKSLQRLLYASGYLDHWWAFSYLEDPKHLTLCRSMFEANVRTMDKWSLNCKVEELWWIDSSMEEDNIDCLIAFIQACPMLKKLFITVDSTCYTLRARGRFPTAAAMMRKRLCNLKLVKMEGFESQGHEILLAECILDIVSVKPVFTAISSYCSYPRALIKLGPKSWRVAEEVDSELVNAKHLHMSV